MRHYSRRLLSLTVYFRTATSPCKSPGEDRPLLQNQLGTHADAVTLSAITTTCSCGGGPKLSRPNNQQSDGVNEFQHKNIVDDPPLGNRYERNTYEINVFVRLKFNFSFVSQLNN